MVNCWILKHKNSHSLFNHRTAEHMFYIYFFSAMYTYTNCRSIIKDSQIVSVHVCNKEYHADAVSLQEFQENMENCLVISSVGSSFFNSCFLLNPKHVCVWVWWKIVSQVETFSWFSILLWNWVHEHSQSKKLCLYTAFPFVSDTNVCEWKNGTEKIKQENLSVQI